MAERQRVTVFRPYPLQAGERIHIDGGPRGGDWLVIGVDDRKMRLRCPVSGAEVEWDRFLGFVEVRSDETWPRR